MFVFESAVEASPPLSAYTRTSAYALSDDGTFTLSIGNGYPGTYTQADGMIFFTWNAAWSATGALREGTLTVRYNFAAQMDGFEDAVYRLKD